jgi:hypothetical protein
VENIGQFPTPRTKAEVSKLLGLVTYLSKFCPDLAETARAIRQLTHKEVPWSWDAIHDDSLATLKILVTQAPVLRLFDPKLPVTTLSAGHQPLALSVTMMN